MLVNRKKKETTAVSESESPVIEITQSAHDLLEALYDGLPGIVKSGMQTHETNEAIELLRHAVTKIREALGVQDEGGDDES